MTNEFDDLAPFGAQEYGEEGWKKLVDFSYLLINEGEERGLIGPRERERLWSRHILNSAAVIPYLPENSLVADVGSGAGFPGIVIASLCPDVHITLIESMEKRCHWLQYVCNELKLNNVTVFHGRAEDAPKKKFDCVTARAVASLKKLLPWCMPLIRENGRLVLLKGQKVYDEIEEADLLLHRYGAQWVDIHHELPPLSKEETIVLEVSK